MHKEVTFENIKKKKKKEREQLQHCFNFMPRNIPKSDCKQINCKYKPRSITHHICSFCCYISLQTSYQGDPKFESKLGIPLSLSLSQIKSSSKDSRDSQ